MAVGGRESVACSSPPWSLSAKRQGSRPDRSRQIDDTRLPLIASQGIWRHSRRRRCQLLRPQHQGSVRKWEHHFGARIKANASARDECATFFGIAPLHRSGVLGFGFFHSSLGECSASDLQRAEADAKEKDDSLRFVAFVNLVLFWPCRTV